VQNQIGKTIVVNQKLSYGRRQRACLRRSALHGDCRAEFKSEKNQNHQRAYSFHEDCPPRRRCGLASYEAAIISVGRASRKQEKSDTFVAWLIEVLPSNTPTPAKPELEDHKREVAR